MTPVQPLHPLQEPPRASTPDLFCHEDMPTPQELAELAASRTTTPAADMPGPAELAEDCWCLDHCPGPRCRRASQVQSKRKREYEARGFTDAEDSWPQRLLLWHPGDFEATPLTVEAGAPLRSALRNFCRDVQVKRTLVRFVWKHTCRSGCVETVELSDHDKPWDLGFREGRTEHIECEYV